MIRIESGETERLQQLFELQKNLVFATTKDIRQDCARVMINGMLQPAVAYTLVLIHVSSGTVMATVSRSKVGMGDKRWVQ